MYVEIKQIYKLYLNKSVVLMGTDF